MDSSPKNTKELDTTEETQQARADTIITIESDKQEKKKKRKKENLMFGTYIIIKKPKWPVLTLHLLIGY